MEPTHTHEHHVQPVATYVVVYLILLFLLIATVGVALINLGPLNNAVALAIAVVKALLVILFFMGTKYSSRLTWLWAGAGFAFLIILLMTVGDYITRNWESVHGMFVR